MGENTRLLYDLMHYLEENDMDGLLLLVDFEKAIERNGLFRRQNIMTEKQKHQYRSKRIYRNLL
jgi:hypothetical protein